MDDFFKILIENNGQQIWVGLSLVLIFYILKAQDERDKRYQKTIDKLSGKLHLLDIMKDDMDAIADNVNQIKSRVDELD